MSYETELANIAHPTNTISAAISAALVAKQVLAGLLYSEDLPTNTNVKLFRKKGSLTAEAVSESSTYTYSASSEYTESSATCTATKIGICSTISVEEEQFGGLDIPGTAQEQGAGIARYIDTVDLALFDDHDNAVTCGSVLTVDDILQAGYVVRAALKGAGSNRLRGVFDYKGINEVRKEIIKSAATVWSLPSMATLLQGAANLEAPNGYVGSLPGIDLFETSGLPTSSTDDCALVFDPAIVYGQMLSPSVKVRTKWTGASDGTRGFCTEISSWVFHGIIEWNDNAGCTVKSDT